MKKHILFSIVMISVIGLMAQNESTRKMSLNLQAHSNVAELAYGKTSSIVGSLPLFTFTLEGTGSDKIGSTYFFTDWEVGNANVPSNAFLGGNYVEFSREWCWWKDSKAGHLAVHTEFDAGVGYGGDSWGSKGNGWDFKTALLGGVSYFWAGDNYFLQLQLMDRYTFKDRYGDGGNGWQFTIVYNYAPVKWFTLSGYADFYQNPIQGKMNDAKTFHFAIEPYVWFNVTDFLSVGSRLRFTYNNYSAYDALLDASVFDRKFYFVPSISLKWNIN